MKPLIALAIAATLALAACGGDDTPTAATAQPATATPTAAAVTRFVTLPIHPALVALADSRSCDRVAFDLPAGYTFPWSTAQQAHLTRNVACFEATGLSLDALEAWYRARLPDAEGWNELVVDAANLKFKGRPILIYGRQRLDVATVGALDLDGRLLVLIGVTRGN